MKKWMAFILSVFMALTGATAHGESLLSWAELCDDVAASDYQHTYLAAFFAQNMLPQGDITENDAAIRSVEAYTPLNRQITVEKDGLSADLRVVFSYHFGRAATVTLCSEWFSPSKLPSQKIQTVKPALGKAYEFFYAGEQCWITEDVLLKVCESLLTMACSLTIRTPYAEDSGLDDITIQLFSETMPVIKPLSLVIGADGEEQITLTLTELTEYADEHDGSIDGLLD